jgi:DNA replication protein DnaC
MRWQMVLIAIPTNNDKMGKASGSGACLERAEPVLLVGDPGTGKSHLATGLAIAACRQRRRVRFTTAAALVNQLVEAQRE